MEVSGQLQAAAALPLGKEPLVTIVLENGIGRPRFDHWATKDVISGIYILLQ
jgi:hypothetical protein